MLGKTNKPQFGSRKRVAKVALGLTLAIACFMVIDCFNYKNDRFLATGHAKDYEVRERQRVVLLAGPHKTSSSSMQANMSHWLMNKQLYPSLSDKWAWPEIDDKFEEGGCSIKDHPNANPKMFYTFVNAVINNRDASHFCLFKHFTPKQIVKFYSEEFYKRWEQGYSLVIGSEAFDFVASESRYNLSIQAILNQLPWYTHKRQHAAGSDDDVTVVVSYRAPRVSHLISIWHQMKMNDGMTFKHFIEQELKRFPDKTRSVDSLSLAKAFLKRGLNVVLLDMEGIKARGYDTSNIVACDVLGADCTSDKQLISPTETSNSIDEEEKETEVKNVKIHSAEQFGVSPSQLDRIDEVIRHYDCNFADLIHHEKFTVLYGTGVQSVFDDCKHLKKKKPYKHRHDMVKRIREIVEEESFYMEEIETAEKK